MSITHNKNLYPLLNLLINYISSRSALQILSVKGECTFSIWNFLVIGLCNSSANFLFEIFSFLITDLFSVAKISDHASVAALPEAFLSKKS